MLYSARRTTSLTCLSQSAFVYPELDHARQGAGCHVESPRQLGQRHWPSLVKSIQYLTQRHGQTPQPSQRPTWNTNTAASQATPSV